MSDQRPALRELRRLGEKGIELVSVPPGKDPGAVLRAHVLRWRTAYDWARDQLRVERVERERREQTIENQKKRWTAPTVKGRWDQKRAQIERLHREDPERTWIGIATLAGVDRRFVTKVLGPKNPRRALCTRKT